MDDFNAKKSRARKLKNDKFRDRSRKNKVNAAKGTNNKTKSIKVGYQRADHEETSSSNSESEENEGQKYSRGKIVSNRSYYDENLADMSSELPLASLEKLAASDDVTGGIFQFKDEADWTCCPENISNQYFHIDLKCLASSLAAVPLYERVGLPDDFYSSDEKQIMDQEANKKYQFYFQNLTSTKDMEGLDQLLVKVKNQQNEELKSAGNISEYDDDNVSILTTQFKNICPNLTDLLSNKEQSVSSSKRLEIKPELTEEVNEDLTEWLDSILGD